MTWCTLAVALVSGTIGCRRQSPARLAADSFAALHRGGLPAVEIQYPIADAVFPPEIPAPTVAWRYPGTDVHSWLLGWETAAGPVGALVGDTRTREWRPTVEEWNRIKERSVEEDLALTVIGLGVGPDGDNTVMCGGSVNIRTSQDRVGAPVFFRDVPLPFLYAVKNPETIRYCLGDVGTDEPGRELLGNLPVCGNCHSFSADGSVLGMDVDYANDKGSYVLVDLEEETALQREDIITWSDYRDKTRRLTFGLLSQVSPDGRYAVSTVKDRSVFVPKPGLAFSQLFFPIRGILAWYDRKTGVFRSLPGADDPAFVQSNPNWSPDGRYIYFARATALDLPEQEEERDSVLTSHLSGEFLSGKRRFRFDIYRVPFNGGEGGVAEPVKGASGNGRSNYFPRISPDGKWLVFTQSDSFMLLQPDSELYIMPAEGGVPRRMSCNTGRMNSWHSWSPNSRWLVFSSKPRGPYTEMLLTHVAEDGTDSRPVLLEHLSIPGRAANIPEFVNRPYGSLLRITESFMDDYNYVRQAKTVVSQFEDFNQAVKYYTAAVKLNPSNAEAQTGLGAAYQMSGNHDTAEKHLLEALKLDPRHLRARHTLISLYMTGNRFTAVREQCGLLLADYPDEAEAHRIMGLAYGMLGDTENAEVHLKMAVELQPHGCIAHYNLGSLYSRTGRAKSADREFRMALSAKAPDVRNAVFVAEELFPRTEFAGRIDALISRIIERDGPLVDAYVLRARLRLRDGDLDGAIAAFEAAREAAPDVEWIPAKIAELKSRQRPKSRD